jgi:aspartyl-tRNA(Asn)/glutamyl-tRNA(Gln) amidotransferase subunit C
VNAPASDDATTPEVRVLDDEVVAKVARLARLELTPAELTLMTKQLSGMLEHFRDIDKLDLSAVAPMAQPLPLKNVMREDVVQPCLDRDEVLAAAPAAQDHRFRVPPTIGFVE